VCSIRHSQIVYHQLYKVGEVSATVSIASNGFSITFASHPNGDNYIAQFCLIGRNGYIFQGSSSSTAIFISTATTDFTQTADQF
jgi:hypothetical protein